MSAAAFAMDPKTMAALSAGMSKMGEAMNKVMELGIMDKVEMVIDKMLTIANSPFIAGLNVLMSYITAGTAEASARELGHMLALLEMPETQASIKILIDFVNLLLSIGGATANILTWVNAQFQTFLALFGTTGDTSSGSGYSGGSPGGGFGGGMGG